MTIEDKKSGWHKPHACKATAADMVYNSEKTKNSKDYCYFTCRLCGLPSRVIKRDVDLKDPVWHLASSYRKRHGIPPHRPRSRSQPARGLSNAPPRVSPAERRELGIEFSESSSESSFSSDSSYDSEQSTIHDASGRKKLSDEIITMFDDIHTIGQQRNELLKSENELKVALEKACEIVKKCKQECLDVHGEILKAEAREKEILASVPRIARALASGK